MKKSNDRGRRYVIIKKIRKERSFYMKKNILEPYDKPKIEVIAFNSTDVIATSAVSGDDMDNDGWTSV